MFKSKFILASILALTSAQAFAATDLQKDLETPFEPLSNPFTNMSEQRLDAGTESALSAFLLKCFYRPVNRDLWDEMHVSAECAGAVKTKVTDHDKNGRAILSPVVEIHAGALQFTAVSWDGDDSDHGDEMALGIYDPQGNRIAIYKGLYLEGNTFDALSGAVGVGAKIRQVNDPSLAF